MSKDRSPRRFSRRDFLKLAWNTGVYATAAYGAARLGIDIATYTPHNPDTFTAQGYEPGWLETRNGPLRPPLIADGKGQKKWLKYMSRDLLLNKLHTITLTDLINPEREKVSLRQDVWRNILMAYQEMKHTNAHVHDIVHAMLLTYASTRSNFYTVGEVRSLFGVYDYDQRLSPDSNFDIGAYRKNIPDVVPDFPNNDVSTIQHWAGFAAIAYEYAYAVDNNLPEATNVPLLAQAVAAQGENTKDKAFRFALSGELAWEAMESKAWAIEVIGKKSYFPPDQGFGSPDFDLDFTASMMGVNFGLHLYGEIHSGDDLYERCAILDEPNELLALAF